MNKLFKFPVIIILILLAITVFFGMQLKNIEFDNEIGHFIPEDNPANVMKDKIDSQFGDNYTVVIGLELEKGTVFDRENLLKIYKLSRQFEENPVYDEVMSLSSVELVFGNDEGMVVERLISDDFSGTAAEIDAIKSRLMSWDKYLNALVSEDFTATEIILSKEDNNNLDADLLYSEAKKILAEADLTGFKTYIAGAPAVSALLSRNMKTDLVLLVPIVILVVALILLIIFRTLSGVILPLITVLFSTVWTIGFMALLHVKLSMIATVIPVLMIAVGSAYGIHIITHHYDDLRKRVKKLSSNEYRELVFDCLRKVGPSVILAGLTTIVGFGSLSFSKVMPMQTFGIFSAVGVLAALFISLLLIPSIILLRQPKLKNSKNGTGGNNDETADGENYLKFISRKKIIISAVLIILGISIFGTTLVVTDNNLVRYFKYKTEIAQSDAFLNKHFNGISTMTVVIEGSEKGELLDPAFLDTVADMGDYLKKKHPDMIGEVFSFADLLMRMNKVMHWDDPSPWSAGQENTVSDSAPEPAEETQEKEGDDWGFSDLGSFEFGDLSAEGEPEEESLEIEVQRGNGSADEAALSLALLNQAVNGRNAKHISAQELISLINIRSNYEGEAFNEIPLDPQKYGLESRQDLENLISQYLLLYSGATSSLIDDPLQPQKMKITIQLKSMSSLSSGQIKASVLEYADKYIADKNVLVSGLAVISMEVTRLVTQTQKNSILISIFLVFLILLIHFKSFAAGLIGIVPLATAIMINFAVMGISGIRLDISTAMIASIAIGIGIDYTIHFLSTYRHERLMCSDENEVCRRTIQTTGKAIIFNAVSVGLGFSVLLFSQFNPLAFLGLLIMLTMATSSLAAIIVLPVLLRIFKPKFLYKQ